MKRIVFWGFVSLGAFVLLFFALNLFDGKPARETTTAGPAAANLEPGNAFFILWGFAEPPDVEPLGAVFRDQVLELFRSRPRSYFSRSRHGQWLARLNAAFRTHWQGARLHFPQLPGEDICAHFAARQAEISQRQALFATPRQRYRRLLQAARLADFTPLSWEPPARSLLLASYMARLHAAAQALEALDGRWLEAGAGLLEAMEAGFRLMATARTIAVNALGKGMVELSLRTLASLLNRRDCPAEFVQLVRAGLPPRPVGHFGTGPVRAFHWQSFAAAVARVKQEKVVDPLLLKDYFRDPTAFYTLERFVAISRLKLYTTVHGLASFFVKENETVAMMKGFWDGVGELEASPPWKWNSPPLQGRRSSALATGPLWWLHNPLGKMMVRAAVPFNWPVLQHYVYRSHELRARYELTRLLLRARGIAGPGMELSAAALERLLSLAPERDPFSGTPYRFGPQTQTLYSVGPDRRDEGGRERAETWRDSDIALPLRFAAKGDGR